MAESKERLEMLTETNSSYFGELTRDTMNMGACGNQTFSVYAGGLDDSYNVIKSMYSTTYNGNNSTNYFGDLFQITEHGGGCSNETVGLFAGGQQYGGDVESVEIEKILFSSLANTTYFGDLLGGRSALRGSSDNNDTGLFVSGYSYFGNPGTDIKQKITFSSESNAINWGTLMTARAIAAVSEGM